MSARTADEDSNNDDAANEDSSEDDAVRATAVVGAAACWEQAAARLLHGDAGRDDSNRGGSCIATVEPVVAETL